MKRVSVIVVLVLMLGGVAHAQKGGVGIYAPSAPFPSTSARVELATRLAEHISKAMGSSMSGRNYARASDFAAAVKSGAVSIAVVDSTYLASTGGNYVVISAAVRGGAISHGWQLVARGTDSLAALKGKQVLAPSANGREVDFVLNVLLSGEVPRDYFAKIEASPDTASALTALGLGKADAAVVPAGVELPSGVRVVVTLPALPGPALVAYGLTAQQRQQLATAAASFSGDATISGFRGTDADTIRALARRFTAPVKRGPHAIPAVRMLVGDLVEGRTFTMERTSAAAFVIAPD